MANYSEVGGENAELFRAIINDTPYTGEITSRNSAILDSIIKGSAYTDPPQSEIEALLLDLKEKIEGGGSIEVEELNVTENGTYTADVGKAFNPVNVDIAAPVLITKNITANGVYNASADNADGYATANVNVPLPENAYLLKSIEGVDIATFTDGTDNFVKALEVAIEPQQDLHGYDAPWVGGAGKNKLPMTVEGIKAVNTDGTWSGNTYTHNGVAYTVNTDSDDNILSIKVNGTSTSISYLVLTNTLNTTTLTGCIVNGLVANVSSIIYRISSTSDFVSLQDLYNNYTIEDNGNNRRFSIRVSGSTTNEIIYPMIRLASETDPTFEPYSNICPISGWDECNITEADDLESPTTSNVYTIDLNGTRYGGKLDVVNGVLTLTDGFISSYNGETLPSTWISDRDVYAEGTTPTIGAEVCYKLATPQTIQLSPTIIKSLQGGNNFFADSGEVIKLQYWGKEQS